MCMRRPSSLVIRAKSSSRSLRGPPCPIVTQVAVNHTPPSKRGESSCRQSHLTEIECVVLRYTGYHTGPHDEWSIRLIEQILMRHGGTCIEVEDGTLKSNSLRTVMPVVSKIHFA